MNHLTHPFRSDEIMFTKQDLMDMMDGKELSGCGVVFKMQKEPKPDIVRFGCYEVNEGESGVPFQSMNLYQTRQNITPLLNVRQCMLVFDGETQLLKSTKTL